MKFSCIQTLVCQLSFTFILLFPAASTQIPYCNCSTRQISVQITASIDRQKSDCKLLAQLWSVIIHHSQADPFLLLIRQKYQRAFVVSKISCCWSHSPFHLKHKKFIMKLSFSTSKHNIKRLNSIGYLYKTLIYKDIPY